MLQHFECWKLISTLNWASSWPMRTRHVAKCFQNNHFLSNQMTPYGKTWKEYTLLHGERRNNGIWAYPSFMQHKCLETVQSPKINKFLVELTPESTSKDPKLSYSRPFEMNWHQIYTEWSFFLILNGWEVAHINNSLPPSLPPLCMDDAFTWSLLFEYILVTFSII